MKRLWSSCRLRWKAHSVVVGLFQWLNRLFLVLRYFFRSCTCWVCTSWRVSHYPAIDFWWFWLFLSVPVASPKASGFLSVPQQIFRFPDFLILFLSLFDWIWIFLVCISFIAFLFIFSFIMVGLVYWLGRWWRLYRMAGFWLAICWNCIVCHFKRFSAIRSFPSSFLSFFSEIDRYASAAIEVVYPV